jgi:hypothetical protein
MIPIGEFTSAAEATPSRKATVADDETWTRAAEAAVEALRLDPQRTRAGLLCVAAGAAVVVALVSIVQGGRRELLRSVEAAGPSNVFVRAERGAPTPLTTAGIEAARVRFPGLAGASGVRTVPAVVRSGTAEVPATVYGVEPEAGNDTQQSLQRGEIVHIATPRTIADGAQTQSSGRLTFPVIQALVQDVLTVSDAQLVETMRFFASRMKLVVEPTGCLGAAALLEGAIDLRGARVGIIVSGGNVDLARYAALLSGGA